MHIKCWVSNALVFAATQAASDVHKVRCNAAETVSKDQQDFHVEDDGGYMIQIHTKICQGTRNYFQKLLNEYGMSDLIPVYLEMGALSFYLNRHSKCPRRIQRVEKNENSKIVDILFTRIGVELVSKIRRKKTNRIIMGFF